MVITNNIELLEELKDGHRKLFEQLIDNEKHKKKNAFSLSIFFNYKEMIKFFIDLKDIDLLRSFNRYLDLTVSPYYIKVCSNE